MQRSRQRPLRVASVFLLMLPSLAGADGTIEALGPSFDVDAQEEYGIFDVDLAVEPDESFLVVWPGRRTVEADESVSATVVRHFDSSGTPTGPPTPIGDTAFPLPDEDRCSTDCALRGASFSNRSVPAVAASPAGEFVVVWPRRVFIPGLPFVFPVAIEGRIVSQDGEPAEEPFTVFDGLGSSVYTDEPDVAFAPNGDFAVVWQHFESGEDEPVLHFRRHASDGTPLGPDVAFADAADTSFAEYDPAIAVTENDEALVTWRSRPRGGLITYRVLGQHLSGAGAVLSDAFVLDAGPLEEKLMPQSAAVPGDTVLVAWRGDALQVVARTVELMDPPEASELVLDEIGGHPSVSAAPNAESVAAWSADLANAADLAVQWFDRDGAPLGPVLGTSFAGASGTQVGAQSNRRLVVVRRGGAGVWMRRFEATFSIFDDGFEDGTPNAWAPPAPR